LDKLNKLSNNSNVNKSSNSNLIEENIDTHLKDISNKQKGKEIANTSEENLQNVISIENEELKHIQNSNNSNDVTKKSNFINVNKKPNLTQHNNFINNSFKSNVYSDKQLSERVIL